MERQNITVLTGAGISAESGIKTFRDGGGLWEGYRVEEVATPDAWERNPGLVLKFYNERRRDLHKARPNAAHRALTQLEDRYNVTIVTQNVDDLHERAGSSNVIHLHGELLKARSSVNPLLIYDIEGDELKLGQLCEKGFQLRPHIVWFGEAVPMMPAAIEATAGADYFIVIGTSLVVYPAAGLLEYVREEAPVYVIDPKKPSWTFSRGAEFIVQEASRGVPEIVERLLNMNKGRLCI